MGRDKLREVLDYFHQRYQEGRRYLHRQQRGIKEDELEFPKSGPRMQELQRARDAERAEAKKILDKFHAEQEEIRLNGPKDVTMGRGRGRV
jgi:hypothetical protein